MENLVITTNQSEHNPDYYLHTLQPGAERKRVLQEAKEQLNELPSAFT